MVSREQYHFDDLDLDVEAATLTRGGLRLELPKLSFDLLVALVRRAPDVVSADELITTVWQGVAISNETLTQRVALLRRALGEDAQNPRYLRAVRGRGYQLIPPVERPGENGVSVATRPASRWRRLAGLALTIGLGLGVWALRRHEAPEAQPLATRPAQAAELVSRAGTYLERHQQADNERAIELYRRALELDAQQVEALAGLSLALSQRSTKFNLPFEPEAETLARRALALSPQSGRAQHALALTLDAQGRLREALAAYLEAAQRESAPAPVLASAAHLLQVSGRLAEALETNLRAARAPGPTPIYLEVQLGSTLYLLEANSAAQVWFERALALKPDNVFAAAAFAQMRLSQGRNEDADRVASEALARDIRRPDLYRVRGLVAERAGRREEARSFFAEALALVPDDVSTRVRFACLDPRTADPELAAEIGRELERGDTWPTVAYDQMLLATCAGDFDTALVALDRAIALGFRDRGWLLLDPMLAELRAHPGFTTRLEELSLRVDAERQKVEGAPWLPEGFLAGSAANR